MKKFYATIAICLLSTLSFSQVSFTVLEPASIAGGYPFTSNGDGTDWGLPNLLDPLDAVQDTLMLVDDGTSGLNAQGVPLANEGCGPLINDLTGKIAVVYRYDGVSSNVCWYGTKVLNAQNAGAVGVIMINREDALIDVPGTTDGPSTTIPFAFISKSDGELLRARMDAGDDVVAFIGSKLGLYADDIGIVKDWTLAPSIAATASQTSQNASEFGFDVGSWIYNYGQNTQNNVMITASVNGPGGTWTETAGPFSILPGDTIPVFTGGANNIPGFSHANYPDGRYTLDYLVDMGVTDESDFDNALEYEFVISDSIVTFCTLDDVTNLPSPTRYTRTVDPTSEFTICMVYDNPNGSRLAADGMYFSAMPGWQSGLDLEGEEIAMNLFQWNDVFTDVTGTVAFDNLSTIAFGYYYFGANEDEMMIHAQFENPVQLADNQRYLACVSTANNDVWFGFDNRIDYSENINHYLQPLSPVWTDVDAYWAGFGADLTPAIGMSVFDAADLSIDENPELSAKVYPNPATDQLNIVVSNSNQGHFIITDLSGRLIDTIEMNATTSKVDISNLESGQYILVIESATGEKGQYNFTKI